MMPETDGLELCRLIRKNDITCHIPVILLTAKADLSSKISGLETGADDYLIKPFDKEELFARVDNLLSIRRRLKEKFSLSGFQNSSVGTSGNRDNEYISRLIRAIEKNIIRSDFTVELLAGEMNISRRTLERKTEALTGLNPVVFIRTVKIRQAAFLIAEKGLDISEAAFSTGFSSLSYFSRTFREIIGVKPSDYRRYPVRK